MVGIRCYPYDYMSKNGQVTKHSKTKKTGLKYKKNSVEKSWGMLLGSCIPSFIDLASLESLIKSGNSKSYEEAKDIIAGAIL